MKIRGIHEYCTKCSKTVTSPKSRCGKKAVLARNCPFKDKHKPQSRIWNPLTQRTDKIKTWDTRNEQELLQLHLEFKTQVKEGIAQEKEKQKKTKEKPMPLLLGHCMAMYMEWVEDIGVPEHELKNLSKDYINTKRRILKRFAKVVGAATPVHMINKSHVGDFHKSLDEYGAKTYNHHMQAMSSFFLWLIKYGYDIQNPFEDVKEKPVTKAPAMIEIEDLMNMMRFITPENGIVTVKEKSRGGYEYKKTLYRKWLKHAIGLFLMTGERRDGVFLLKWEHVHEDYINIPNYKINRKENTEKHSRDIVISPELDDLLDDIGRRSEGYVIAPDRENRNQVKEECSRAFSHFWKKSGNKGNLQLKNLRKTYTTTMRMELGDLAKALKINTDEVQFSHYIDQKKIREKVRGKRIFDIDFKD